MGASDFRGKCRSRGRGGGEEKEIAWKKKKRGGKGERNGVENIEAEAEREEKKEEKKEEKNKGVENI